MKKIKSVKLKNDELKKGAWGNWLFSNCDFPVFSEEQITGNPSAFEIEYEEERKYIDVRIEYDAENNNVNVDTIKNALDIWMTTGKVKVFFIAEGNYENPA